MLLMMLMPSHLRAAKDKLTTDLLDQLKVRKG